MCALKWWTNRAAWVVIVLCCGVLWPNRVEECPGSLFAVPFLDPVELQFCAELRFSDELWIESIRIPHPAVYVEPLLAFLQLGVLRVSNGLDPTLEAYTGRNKRSSGCEGRFRHYELGDWFIRRGYAVMGDNLPQYSRASTEIFPFEQKPESLWLKHIVDNGVSEESPRNGIIRNPSSLSAKSVSSRIRCLYGSLGGSSVEVDSVKQSQSSGCGQHKLQLGPQNNLFSRIGHALLRDKIFFFTLGGFLLLPLGALGLFWLFEYPDRKTKRRGLALATVVLPIAFALVVYGLFG